MNGEFIGFDPDVGTVKLRIKMKLIRIAFLAAAMLAFNASAQPAPQASTNHPAPSATVMQAPKAPPMQAPRVPPSLTQGPTAPPPPMPAKDKLSYAIGSFFANQVKHDHLDLDVETVVTAMKDVLNGNPPHMTEEEVKETITQLQKALPTYIGNLNKAKGEEYMAQNAKAPGVTTLTNGLQYKVLKEGTGPMPTSSDSVVVNYKGTLIDGTVFDQRDGFTNKVTGQTIKGWSQILPLMKTGSKWQVTIPPDLAYGARGPQKIGANATLVFDMELVSILPPAPAPLITNTPKAAAQQPTPVAPVAVKTPASGSNLPPPIPGTGSTPVVSGQIIKVPSAEELKKGAKIEVITNAPNN
jgi:FKBP-type peptidyl-prolyl cis-trans isomerase